MQQNTPLAGQDPRQMALLTGMGPINHPVPPPNASVVREPQKPTELRQPNDLEPGVLQAGKHPPRWRRVLAPGDVLLSLFPSLWRRRVPQLLQMSEVECAAACLAMILGYYGRQTSIAEISERSGVGRDGLSALALVRAARDYGLRVRAISLPDTNLRSVSLPAIVHWQFNHFLIVEGWSATHVDVVDPAVGRKRLTADEFDAGFTGVVIMLEPGVQFVKHTAVRRITLRAYLAQFLKRAPFMLVQILVVTLLLQLFGLAVPLLTAVVVDRVIPSKMLDLLPLLGIGMVIVLFAQFVTTLLRAMLLVYLQARIDLQLMSSFVEHLLSLPQSFFHKRSNGDILARLNSNTAIRDLISEQLVSAFLDGSLVMVYLVVLFIQSQAFGLFVLAVSLLQVLLLLLTDRPVRAWARRELETDGKAQGYMAEVLTGISTLKAAGAEQRAFAQWANLFCNQLNVFVRRQSFSAAISTSITTVQALSPLVLLWIGATQVIRGSLQVGTMLALSALAASFLASLTSLVRSGQQLQVVNAHLERIADVLDAQPEQDLQCVQVPPHLSGHIHLEHVSFQYDATSPNVLQNITLSIEAGQKIAIVGRTGSGKSTLGKLLLGLCLPTAGEIFYDGIPLRYLNYQAVRSQFGVVMQDAVIFSGSIRQNITLNALDIGIERVSRAAQRADLHDTIMKMPMGYETYVSEGGRALSGGQRQRLAIARALAHAPAILLLDEATSALDVVTEQRVEANLRALPCTQISIAHRLSTIRHADCILVLDEGRLVEQGTHQELLQKNGYYAKLMQNQLASGEMKVETTPRAASPSSLL
jgi:ATP-binding cassette, subfamily B, bacterial